MGSWMSHYALTLTALYENHNSKISSTNYKNVMKRTFKETLRYLLLRLSEDSYH